MDVHTLKQLIIDNDKIESILEDLGMHHIVKKDEYWSCGMPDGDNTSSTIIYNSENLNTIAYTRKINSNENAPSDIFTLIQFIKDISFFKAINYVCELLDVEYYSDENIEVPLGLQFLNEIFEMNTNTENIEDTHKTKIRNNNLLNYYSTNCNYMFKQDGISFSTQKEFKIGYDDYSNRITIPIFNELGQLVGVKGRLFECDTNESKNKNVGDGLDKYIYLEKCNKNRILYGLYKTYNEIMYQGIVYVGESEKFVLQLWTANIRNAVGIGGHKISSHQLTLLQRLGVKVCLCFDKDIVYKTDDGHDDIFTECSKFAAWIKVYYIHDTINILEDKESPSDNIEKFKRLSNECMYSFER